MSESIQCGAGSLGAWTWRVFLACTLSASAATPAMAATALTDSTIGATANLPGNLALVLSVEYPTAESVAYTNRKYNSRNAYLGYFDADKCYAYRYSASDTTAAPNLSNPDSYFYPTSLASNHKCTDGTTWSGNFMNWATTQTIDPFRWALTGGYRLIDRSDLTVLEKAQHYGQGDQADFPNSEVTGTDLAGAVPTSVSKSGSTDALGIAIHGFGNTMRFATGSASYDFTGGIPYDPDKTVVPATKYDVFVRVKVCDPLALDAGGGKAKESVESNCVKYPNGNYKPEGLMQKYANSVRYSVLGYLNDSDLYRDGGVLRARQKFIGPTQPVIGGTPITNVPGAVTGQVTGGEWDASTGVFITNPDSLDADNTNKNYNLSRSNTGYVTNSGAMNYINAFGQSTGSYKVNDNVSELYYAAIRYFKNLPPASQWIQNINSDRRFADTFPVISSYADPILYSCQKNFILGIGDVNTHADKNVAGNLKKDYEPTMPNFSDDLDSKGQPLDAPAFTNRLGVMEGLGQIGTSWYNSDANQGNSAYIAGLAYYAHTTDIRTDLAKTQTIDTYWVDVQEGQIYLDNNQYYLAAKYGGFSVPEGFDPYARTEPLPKSLWSTSGDTFGSNDRPDNYFSGGRPDLMINGLTAAFTKIAASIGNYSSAYAIPISQVTQSGSNSYSSTFDPVSWTGEVKANTVTFDSTTYEPSLTEEWKFSSKLAVQLTGSGWNTARRVVTWNGSTGVPFRAASLAAADLVALDPTYISGDDSGNYIKYIRGDQSNEVSSISFGSTTSYRTRTSMVGDILTSGVTPVGPPRLALSDATNTGYAEFKSLWSGRPTVVYAAANDGMLHAINGSTTSASTCLPTSATCGGTELFAYIPKAVIAGPNATPSVDGLASLGNPTFVHHQLVNATPRAFDVDFSKTMEPASAAADWHSILIGGLGKGGKSYYAIDVTDPISMGSDTEANVAAKVLWEFTDPDMGYTFGQPLVTKTKKYGWVVVLTSGYNNRDGQGYFFFVNPRTGALLEKVSTGVGSVAGDAGLAHANAFITDATDGTADAIYAGDLLGNLWRLDVTGTTRFYDSPTKLARLTDASNVGQPVTSRPMIEVHPVSKVRFVLVGTGRLLDESDLTSSQSQSFYAIADGTNSSFNATPSATGVSFPITRASLAANTDVITGVTYDATTQMGWYVDLGLASGVGWRITTDATTVLGAVAFTATLQTSDVCSSGSTSRVYSLDYASAATFLTKTVSGTTTPLAYTTLEGTVTSLKFLSVAGKVTLIAGTSKGEVDKLDTKPLPGLSLRRLGWREIQSIN